MKKYFFGILAVVLAIGFSAFTKPATRPFTTYTFKYTGTLFTQADVENKARWAIGTLTCTPSGERACTIEVPQSATNANHTALASDVTIQVNIPSGSAYGVEDVLQSGFTVSPTIENKQ